MAAYVSSDYRNRNGNIELEVMEKRKKYTDKRLTKVNHPKGWDTKPLV